LRRAADHAGPACIVPWHANREMVERVFGHFDPAFSNSYRF
jgi:hypothetical protein